MHTIFWRDFMDIISMMNEYLKTELLIITPVLYLIARYLKSSHVKTVYIPWILLGISVILSGLYIFASNPFNNATEVLMAIFTTIVQGILLSGTAVYGGILGQVTKQLYQDKNNSSATPDS